MKKLLLLILFVAVGVGVWFRNSPRYSIWRITQALQTGDVRTIDALVDLNAFAALPAEAAFAAVQTADAAPKEGLAAAIVDTLGAMLTGAVKTVATPFSASELRRRIELHDLEGLTGSFKPDFSELPLASLRTTDYGAILTVEGTCLKRGSPKEQLPASIGIRFTRVDGPVLSYPRDWKAVGVDVSTLKTLAATCELLKAD